MSVRSIDENRDWNFGQGKQSYVSKVNEIAQMVRTRVLSFFGDCFFAPNEGIDWINLMGKYGEVDLLKSIKLTILQTPGVTSLTSLDVVRDKRNLTVYYSLTTIYTESIESTIEVGNV